MSVCNGDVVEKCRWLKIEKGTECPAHRRISEAKDCLKREKRKLGKLWTPEAEWRAIEILVAAMEPFGFGIRFRKLRLHT